MDTLSPSLIRQKCFVNGAFIGEPVDPVTNPATGDVIASVPRFGAKEAKAAIEAAHAAFPAWSGLLAKQRSQFLRRWYELQIAHTEELAAIMTAENGKPLSESRVEVAYGSAFVEFYAEEAKRIYGETIPSHKGDARVVTIRQPIGVVGAITPWNFPFAMITRKVSPALAAGCTVVVKPAPDTPLTALALAELAQRAGFPAGVLNIITGDAEAIGTELTTSPLVRGITFTGSTRVGKILMSQASSTVKRVGLELGGNAPFIIFDDADLDKAVTGLIANKYRNMGQVCVSANRVLVQDGIYDQFAEKLAAAVSKLKVGPGTEEGVQQGPLINQAGLKKVETHVNDAVSKGARALTGGKRHALGHTFFEPTVLVNVTTDMQLSCEETFGPVASLFRFKTEEDAVSLANATPHGLASYFYTKDLARAWRVGERIQAGMVGINDVALGFEAAPFGGIKESGLGREGSHHGIEEFVDIKYMLFGGITG
jgi:succinate-semialdehyde dehydrogenase / glutarate-semialdehyde dehydrogenase